MKLYLKAGNGSQEKFPVIARFAGLHDRFELEQWTRHNAASSPQGLRDAVSYAEEALSRWGRYQRENSAVESVEAALTLIAAKDPPPEIALLFVLEASWWEPGKPAAFAYLRRTSFGNLYLEYLAKHPLSFVPGLEFSGVSRAFFAWFGDIATKLDSSFVWWEATVDSRNGYDKLFGAENLLDKSGLNDLFAVRSECLKTLASGADKE